MLKDLTVLVIGIIGCFLVTLAIVLPFYYFTSKHDPKVNEENALHHAQKLQLKDPIISCDQSWNACGCTISHITELGRKLDKFGCCGQGCE